jgi:hypothetical protein
MKRNIIFGRSYYITLMIETSMYKPRTYMKLFKYASHGHRLSSLMKRRFELLDITNAYSVDSSQCLLLGKYYMTSKNLRNFNQDHAVFSKFRFSSMKVMYEYFLSRNHPTDNIKISWIISTYINSMMTQGFSSSRARPVDIADFKIVCRPTLAHFRISRNPQDKIHQYVVGLTSSQFMDFKS